MDSNATCELCTGKELANLQFGSADYLIVYVVKGEVQLATLPESRRVTADRVMLLTRGSGAVQLQASEECECYILPIQDLRSSHLVQHHLALMGAQDRVVSVVDASKQKGGIFAVFKNMAALPEESLEHSEALQGMLQELMVRVYRASLEVPAKALVMVAEIRKRLDEEFYQEFSLEMLATEYRTSVSYLLHAFKKIHGMPIMRYLLNRRILAAKEYLEHSAMPIYDVAKQCGFHDISNFGRTFKKETGYSPRQYRKQFRDME